MTRTAVENQAAEAMEAVKPPTLRWTIQVKKKKGKESKRASVRAGADSRGVRSIPPTYEASAHTLLTCCRSYFGSAFTQ
jgi:hypothetical protein